MNKIPLTQFAVSANEADMPQKKTTKAANHNIACPHCRGTGKVPDAAKQGRQLKEQREAKTISQRRVARSMNISPAFLCDLEAGKRNWTRELISGFRLALRKISSEQKPKK